MHLKVADRVRSTSRPVDWRGRRELGLLLTVTTLTPVAMFAVEVGSPGEILGALMLSTLVIGALAVRWIHREYLISPLSLSAESNGIVRHSHKNHFGISPTRVDSTIRRGR